MKRILPILLIVFSLSPFVCAQYSVQSSPAARLSQSVPEAGTQAKTLLVLPFENMSKAPGIEWLGEAFSEVLAQRMASPTLYAIPRQDRVYAFDRSGIPANLKPSRATLFRIAEQMDADYVVLGSYNFDGQTFTGIAQLLDVKGLHLSQEFTESGPLVQVLDIQNALAWDLLHLVDRKFATSRQAFLAGSPSIRLDAFENYIRGVVATSRPEKIKKFREAVRINPDYNLAIMQLGKTYFAARDYDSAASWFGKVPKTAPESREANFYAGLSYYYIGQFDRAATAFSYLAEQFPLTEVYNNLGVVEARRGRKDAADFFQKAVEADPGDADYHFNLGVTLYRNGSTGEAIRELQQAIKLRPNDAEAKSLLDQLSASATANNLPTPAAAAIAQNTLPSHARLPYERIKRNYDETSFRQLALEIQNASELRLANASPKEHAAYHVEHGRDLLSHGFTTEAIQELTEAVQVDPSNAAGHAALAQALENSGDTAKARNEANASLQLKRSADAYLVLARIDLRDNKAESAAQYVDRALALEPANTAAGELKQKIAAKLAERTQPLQQR